MTSVSDILFFLWMDSGKHWYAKHLPFQKAIAAYHEPQLAAN
jgi:hypothetical protein